MRPLHLISPSFYEARETSQANASVFASGATAYSKGRTRLTLASNSRLSTGSATPVFVPRTVLDWVNLTYSDFTWNALEQKWYAYPEIVVKSLRYATLVEPTSGGGGVSSSASGIAQVVLKPHNVVNRATFRTLAADTDSIVDGIFVTIETSNDVYVVDWGVNVDSGEFEVPLVDLGTDTYNFYFSAPGSLRRKVSEYFDNTADITGVDASLVWGDIDQDNYVSLAEVNYIYSVIGAEESHGISWDVDLDGDGFFPAMADLDRDGEVTSADYNLCSSNVGLSGD